jgi:hypothetical protein
MISKSQKFNEIPEVFGKQFASAKGTNSLSFIPYAN